MTTTQSLRSISNFGIMEKIIDPLELLVVSDQRPYRVIGDRYFSGVTTPQGSTLYNVHPIDTRDLSSPNTPSTDVLLFDLREDLGRGLSILEAYLLTHQKAFVVASVEDSTLDVLLENPRWQDMWRNANGLALTQNYRFGLRASRRLGDEDYSSHFTRVDKELLTDVALAILDNLRNDVLQVTKTIIPHPTEFS